MGSRLRRREFLRRCGVGAGAVAIPYILPSGLLAQPSPNEVTVRGLIGVGGRGGGLLGEQLDRMQAQRDVRVAAVCDVDEDRLNGAVRAAQNAGADCQGYRDYRELLDREDIDVVYIATPPHWHALVCIHAAQAGKDIYCEKPFTRFIHEGRAVVEAVHRYGRVLQIGTFGRFGAAGTRRLLASGVLGTPVTIHMNQHRYAWKVREWSGRTDLQPEPVPANLDWELWLGPAPWKPYHPHRCHGSFRGYWDYDGGGFSDMGAHYFDPIQYTIGADDTGPVEIEARAPWPTHPDAVGMWESITYRFADGTMVVCNSGEWGRGEPADTPYIEGPQGRILNDDKTDPPDLWDQVGSTPEPAPLVDFETALRTREQPGGNAEVAHRTASILHLGNLAIRLGRKLRWDPAQEQFVGDEEANRFVNIPLRAPWHL